MLFEDNVERVGECLIWRGDLSPKGYGVWKGRGAHRVAYEAVLGKVPPKLQLHHICRNKACVRVDHLSVLTTKEHADAHRPTVCKEGHPLAGSNLYVQPKTGNRQCKICRLRRMRKSIGWQGNPPNAAKTHCIHGHALEGQNLWIDKEGKRRCRACGKERRRKWLAENPKARETLRRLDRDWRERKRASEKSRVAETAN